MYSKCFRLAITCLLLPVLVCPLLLLFPAEPAYAAPFLDLVLDAPAVVRWDISNIVPGDTGIEVTNLHNAGNVTGYVYIWITDLVDGEGVNPESETGDTADPGTEPLHFPEYHKRRHDL